jgi:hypothetical protein
MRKVVNATRRRIVSPFYNELGKIDGVLPN